MTNSTSMLQDCKAFLTFFPSYDGEKRKNAKCIRYNMEHYNTAFFSCTE